MAVSEFVSELRNKLSAKARVITDASQKEFQLALLRWSDVNVTIPGAIVQVSNEFDAAITVISTFFVTVILLTNLRLGENRIAAPNPVCAGLRWS